MTVVRTSPPAALDLVSEALVRELRHRLDRGDVRMVALVDVGDDEVLRERLALACAGIADPVIAVFETRERALR